MKSITKTAVFTLIAVTIPVFFLLLLEIGLTALGYGKSIPLFISNPAQQDYLLPRPDILTRYFSEAQTPRVTMEANFLLKQKPKHGFRVVVQGGSTAAGFPYGLGASIAGMLDQRLKQSMPNQHVEVVNTAMSAVNSYVLLDITDDIIAQSPDLVVIYAGHNEYLGIFGVGSTFGVGGPILTSTYMAMNDYATVDFIRHLLPTASKPSIPTDDDTRRTFMSQVASNRSIPFNSGVYHAGLVQFERNLSSIIQKYQAANIPVIVSTIASNERHQRPFASPSIDNKLANELDTHTPPRLMNFADKSVDIDNANFHYELATRLLAAGQSKRAKRHFGLAKDHDLLRFRAPSAINDIIRQIALNHGVFLNDAEYALASRSPDNIIGDNVMLEHLHPNLAGYFIISNSIYDTIVRFNLAPVENEVSANTAWRHRPVIPSEEYYGFAQVQALKADYPFVPSPVPVALPVPTNWEASLGRRLFDKKLSWLEMIRLARQRYIEENNEAMILKTTLIMADALPHDGLVNAQASDLLIKAERQQEARYYQNRADRAGLVSR